MQFQHTLKTDISEFNKEEARGWIIEHLNELEAGMKGIIINYFQPANRAVFWDVVLNNSVVNFGSKLKILRNIPGFDYKSIIPKLQRLSSIRNGIAHTTDSLEIEISTFERAAGHRDIQLDFYNQIHVMRSDGAMKTEKLHELVQEFSGLYTDVQKYLSEFKPTGM